MVSSERPRAALSEQEFRKVAREIAHSGFGRELKLKIGRERYSVTARSAHAVALIRGDYTAPDLSRLAGYLEPATRITVRENGLVQAADRKDGDAADPTHYDAVWVRDSLWAYLGLSARPQTRADAKRVLRRMIDYVATEPQLKRMAEAVADPSVLEGDDGPMRAVHIRFDGRSPTMDDVQVDGKPQRWNHKQNDAVGLLLDLALRALQTGEIAVTELSDANWNALAGLTAYLGAIRFHDMADAGAWEEIERINTSSIALATSGLETLKAILEGESVRERKIAKRLREGAQRFGKPEALETAAVAALVDKGYERVLAQLAAGGESPSYPESDPRHRKADAALLNLIYPARLSRLTREHKEAVLRAIEPLIGGAGIKRYLGDSYQGGNFWFLPGDAAGKTDDTSSESSFAARGSRLLAGSEAQWFFDSWYSRALGELARATEDKAERERLRARQVRHLNRALAQITGGNKPGCTETLGADGKPVPAFALPESYNTLVSGDVRFLAPSPITPLNWAKASLVLAIEGL